MTSSCRQKPKPKQRLSVLFLPLLFLFRSHRRQEGGVRVKTKQTVIPEPRSPTPAGRASAVRRASHKSPAPRR